MSALRQGASPEPRGAAEAAVMRCERLLIATVWAGLAAAVYREVLGHDTLVFVGSYNLTAAEPLLILGSISVIACTIFLRPAVDVAMVCALGFLAVLALAVVRGVFVDPVAAIMSLRGIGPVAAFLLIAPFLRNSSFVIERIRDAVINVAIGLSILIWLRILFGVQLFKQVGELVVALDPRPVSAASALLIAVACVFLLSRLLSNWGQGGRRVNVAVALFIVITLLFSGQGTATLCGVFGIAIVMAFERGRVRGLRFFGIALPLIVVGVVALLFRSALSVEAFTGMLPEAISENLADRLATNETRVRLWAGLLSEFSTWSDFNKLFGLPAGQKAQVVVTQWGGVIWQHGLHSMYFGSLVSTGAVGAAFYALMLTSGVSKASLRLRADFSGPGPLTPALGVSMFLMAAMYSYSYDMRGEQGILLMLALVSSRKLPGTLAMPQDRTVEAALLAGALPSNSVLSRFRAAQ